MTTLLAVTFPQGGELLVILAIVLLLFGGRKLPELSRSIGESIKEFRKASENDEDDTQASVSAPSSQE